MEMRGTCNQVSVHGPVEKGLAPDDHLPQGGAALAAQLYEALLAAALAACQGAKNA